MKLKKIAKYLDWSVDVNLWIDEKMVWSGDMILIHAAMNKDNDKKKFLKECKADEAFDIIKKVKLVEKYLDYDIVGGDEYEAVSMRTVKNNVGVYLIVLDISLKEKK